MKRIKIEMEKMCDIFKQKIIKKNKRIKNEKINTINYEKKK